MTLPIFQTNIRELSLMQTQWSSLIKPVIDAPINNGVLLPGVVLISGVTVVNHLLGRKLQGWQLTDTNAAATIYRSQPKSDKTLTLTSNAAVTVDLWVF